MRTLAEKSPKARVTNSPPGYTLGFPTTISFCTQQNGHLLRVRSICTGMTKQVIAAIGWVAREENRLYREEKGGSPRNDNKSGHIRTEPYISSSSHGRQKPDTVVYLG